MMKNKLSLLTLARLVLALNRNRNRRTGKFNCARAYRLAQVKPLCNANL